MNFVLSVLLDELEEGIFIISYLLNEFCTFNDLRNLQREGHPDKMWDQISDDI